MNAEQPREFEIPKWRDEATGRVYCINLSHWIDRGDLLDYYSSDDESDDEQRGTKNPTAFWSTSTRASSADVEPNLEKSSKLGSYSDMFEVTSDDLVLGERLGQGRTAVVWKGNFKQSTSNDVAVKQIASFCDHRKMLQFLSDIRALRSEPHPNIVQILGVTLSEQPIQIVTEYCAGGSCYDLIHGSSPPTDMQAGKIGLDVADAMSHLHALSPKILHRNLTPQNVLLTDAVMCRSTIPHAKVCDYNLASLASDYASKCSSSNSTLMAPEVMGCGFYSDKADVYSFAVFMYELLYLETPLNAIHEVEISSRIAAGAADTIWSKIICACWVPNPSLRPSFLEIKNTLTQVPVCGRSLLL